jgi:putative spermidine/putrescine transport system permease protein
VAGSTTRRAGDRAWVGWVLLALPTLYFLALVAYPLINLMRMSVSVPQRGRVFGEGFSLQNYITIFTDELYLETLWVTFRIGALTSLLALLLGVPLALYIRKARPGVRSLLIFITIAPILISVVVRAYGWIVLLSNRGLVNSFLQYVGVIDFPIRLIFNETGIVIGTAHVLMPFMVLSVLGSLQTIDVALEDAATSLGAKPWRVVVDVVLPLALPGMVAGTILVFILAVSTFVTPILLGGQLVLTLPILALQQFNSTFNWAFGSALIGVLLVAVLATTLLFDRVLKNRLVRGINR